MELFEQAHVAKRTDTTKKEETMKKQFKQMLYGYKKSDNELIKACIDFKGDCDDSSSVSGFSDLELTSSSEANDTTRATVGSPDDIDSILDDLNIDDSPKITTDLTIDSDNEDPPISHELISGDDISTSVELRFDSDENNSCESGEDDEISSSIYPINSLMEIESSQEFDPDGLLASKIHENLNNKTPRKVTKRKLEKGKPNLEDVVPQKVKSGNKLKEVPKQPLVRHPRLLEKDLVSIDTSLNEPTSDSSFTKSLDFSPPFITINATDIPQENFDDVVGKYKHSVIKNIAYDNNELIISENDSSFYSTNIMTLDEEDMDEGITEVLKDDLHFTNDEDASLEIPTSCMESNQDVTIEDSVISIDDTLQSDTPLKSKSDLDNSFKLLFRGDLCICVIKHPAKLYIHGKCKVKCLGGAVEIFGYTLKQEVVEIYAPFSNFVQCLSTVEKLIPYYGLFCKLTSLGISVADAEDIVTTLSDYDAIVSIEPLKSLKVDFVEEHFSMINLFNKSNKYVVGCHAKALERLGCSLYTNKPHKVFEVPKCWQEISKFCFKKQSRGILCGGKGVGKSTCLRYHVNKLLGNGPVLVIDLDIGQSEFTVAGNISATIVNEPLLGPNFTHLRKPKRTLNLGMINPLDDMRRYVNAVVRLIDYCASDEQLRGMRWIVNTMGLCNVVGLHFMTIIILHYKPTYLIQIDSKIVKKRFDIFLRPSLIAAHYEQHKNLRLFSNTTCPDNLNYDFVISQHTESLVINKTALVPRDERYLNFLAYFAELLNIHRCSTLLGVTPYEVQLQDLCVYMNVKIPEGTVQQVLNGKIVALCQHELGSVTKKTHVLADEPLLCHGHGLIRGIDLERGILYVITPLPIIGLQVVDTLLYADWVPELRGQEIYLPAGTRAPYRMPTMYQQKQFMLTPRRRFNPVQLLKMSRGS